jgi:hypothetical protein
MELSSLVAVCIILTAMISNPERISVVLPTAHVLVHHPLVLRARVHLDHLLD